MTGRTEPGKGWQHHRAVLALAVLVGCVYGASLDHEFVFDDGLLVTNNVVSTWPLWRAPDLLFNTPGGVTYRPVRMFSYMVDHALAGGHVAWVFHLSNLLWHLATVVVVYGFATRILRAPIAGLVAAAVFAVHPLGSEAVVYVAGRRDLLLGLFSTGALWCWWGFLAARGQGSGRRLLRLAAAVGLALLALGSKEIAVVLPLLAGLLWVLRLRRQGLPIPRLAALGVFGAVVVLGGMAALLYGDEIQSGFRSLVEGRGLAPQPALTLIVLGHYLGLAIWPATLQADYRPFAFPLPEAALDAASLMAALLIGLWVLAGCALLWRGRAAGVGLLWALTALLPVAQLLPYGELIAEHNAYLPMVGLGLAVGDGFLWLRERSRPVAMAVVVFLIVALGIRSFVRVPQWRDDATLWAATLETAPRAARSRHNLAVALAAQSKLLESREAFRAALDLAPGDPDVLLGLGSIEERIGEHKTAQSLAARALAIQPSVEGSVLLGWALLGQGKLAAAKESFEVALASSPRNAEGLRGMELVEMRLARRRSRRALESRP